MVEAAIVTPLVFLLILSIAWGALLFRSYLTVGHAAKAGARAGSIFANDETSDFAILRSVKSSLGAIPMGNVEEIVIYKSDVVNGAPSAGCAAGTATMGVCNVYSASDLNRPQTDFGAGGWGSDDYWPASTRSASRAAGTAYLGVYVKAKTGSGGFGIPGPNVIERHEVLRLEARSY